MNYRNAKVNPSLAQADSGQYAGTACEAGGPPATAMALARQTLERLRAVEEMLETASNRVRSEPSDGRLHQDDPGSLTDVLEECANMTHRLNCLANGLAAKIGE